MALTVTATSGRAEEPAPTVQTSVAEQIFFQRLSDLVEARKWPEALRHIQQLQALKTEPAWLAPRDGELRLAQIRISRGMGDLTGLLNAARLFLNGAEARSYQLLAIARELQAAEEKVAAIALVKEVLSRTPNLVAAQRLLAEWEPPPEKKPPRPEKKIEVAVPRPARKKAIVAPPPTVESKPEAGPEPDEETKLLALLRSNQAEGNLLGMMAAARRFLSGDRERAQKMLEVARDYFARDDRATATLLTREVLRRTPGFPPAQRLLAEMEAAPAPKP